MKTRLSRCKPQESAIVGPNELLDSEVEQIVANGVQPNKTCMCI